MQTKHIFARFPSHKAEITKKIKKLRGIPPPRSRSHTPRHPLQTLIFAAFGFSFALFASFVKTYPYKLQKAPTGKNRPPPGVKYFSFSLFPGSVRRQSEKIFIFSGFFPLSVIRFFPVSFLFGSAPGSAVVAATGGVDGEESQTGKPDRKPQPGKLK